MTCNETPPKGFGPCERHVTLHVGDLTTPAQTNHVFSKPHSGKGYAALWVIQKPVVRDATS